MASAMSLVRIPPAAPTSAPAMMSTGLLITKPAMAAAVPVKELSNEITTGMSAPPMGSTMVTPNTSAETMMAPRTSSVTSLLRATASAEPKTSRMVPTTATKPSRVVTIRDAGKMMGCPGTSPWSFPEATSEPLNVTQPMTTPSTTNIVVEMVASGVPTMCRKSSMATRAAAPPPTALKSDTSCGIAVIFTPRAR